MKQLFFRWPYQRFFSLTAILMTGLIASAVNAQSSDWERKYYELLSRSANDPVINRFISDQRLEAARVGIDRAVDDLLRNDEDAVALDPEIERVVLDYIRVEDKWNNEELVRALRVEQDGKIIEQHSWLLEMAKEEARALGFSEEAVNDLKLWVAARPVINAYTYSGDPRHPRMVLFEGLVDAYKKANRINSLRAVIRHELGHVFKRDIRNQIRILSIFFASNRDVIPDRPGDRLPMPYWVEIDGLLTEFIQGFNHRERRIESKYNSEQMRQLKALFYEGVTRIRQRLPVERIQALAKKIALTSGANEADTDAAFGKLNAGYFSGRTAANAEAEDGEFDIKGYFKLLQKLRGVWSNSVESGADRVVFLAPGISGEDAAYADAVLQAGPGANLEALLYQHQTNVEAAANDAETQHIHFAAGGLNSHPNLFTRMLNNRELPNMDAFRPWLDPFIGAAELWLDVSKLITEIDQGIQAADRPAVFLATQTVHSGKLKALAASLSQLLIEAVLNDLVGSDSVRIDKFRILREILEKSIENAKRERDRQTREGGATDFLFADRWLEDVGRGGRVISDLVAAIGNHSGLKTKLGEDGVQTLVKQLEDIRPKPIGERRNEELAKLAEACKSGSASRPDTPKTGSTGSGRRGGSKS